MQPVSSMILAMFSRWRIVMMSSILNRTRQISIRVMTMAKPEKMAPATKYGGKIVVCQPGNWAVAKSIETTECTDSTSGVASPASIR